MSIMMSFNAYAGIKGWKFENNNWIYYKDDKALKGRQQINNNWYFFNEDGSLKIGWYMDASNNWYFLDRCIPILLSAGIELILQADG